MNRTITISDLEKLFALVIDKLKEESVSTIEIKDDLYRFIPADNWGSFQDNIILNGSIFDDVDSLKLIISDKNRPFTYVDLDRLATLLHAISQINNP